MPLPLAMNHAVSQAFWHDEATNNKGSKDQTPFMDHSLVVAKGLCNSMKPWAMPCRANQDRWVLAKSSDKTWSSGGGNGKTLQYSCHENLMNSMKRQKAMAPEGEPPGRKVSDMLLGKSRGQLLIAPERKVAGPKWKWCSVVVMSGGESKVQWWDG